MAILVNNKKALFEYEVLEKFEAGIVLAGWEVKSLRSGKGSLQESYIYLKNGAAWLSGAHIAKWPGMLETDQGMGSTQGNCQRCKKFSLVSHLVYNVG